MLTVALKGLAGRKLRAALTALAIIVGVAMISGTYVLTDTISNGFDTIVSNSYKNTDVVITGHAAFKNENGNGVETPPSRPRSWGRSGHYPVWPTPRAPSRATASS